MKMMWIISVIGLKFHWVDSFWKSIAKSFYCTTRKEFHQKCVNEILSNGKKNCVDLPRVSKKQREIVDWLFDRMTFQVHCSDQERDIFVQIKTEIFAGAQESIVKFIFILFIWISTKHSWFSVVHLIKHDQAIGKYQNDNYFFEHN